MIAERGEVTLPELQVILSLPYKTVREGINELVEKKEITFKSGMTYCMADKDDPVPTDKGRSGSMNGKLSLIADRMNAEPALKAIVKHYAADPDAPVLLNRLQILLRVGYVMASRLMQQCKEIGIFSFDDHFDLTPEECRALLGEEEVPAAHEERRPSEKGLMTPEEYRAYIHKRFHPEDASSGEESKKRRGFQIFSSGIDERKKNDPVAPDENTCIEPDDFSAIAELPDFEDFIGDEDFDFDPDGMAEEGDPKAMTDAERMLDEEERAMQERLREARERLMKRLNEIRNETENESASPKKKKRKRKP